MNEYSQLKEQLFNDKLSEKESAEIAEQFRRLESSYNWTNFVSKIQTQESAA